MLPVVTAVRLPKLILPLKVIEPAAALVSSTVTGSTKNLGEPKELGNPVLSKLTLSPAALSVILMPPLNTDGGTSRVLVPLPIAQPLVPLQLSLLRTNSYRD